MMLRSDPVLRRVRVAWVGDLAMDVRGFELEPADGRPLPSAAAGSHIDVHVPSGLVRQYSLCGHVGATDRYRIAVKREGHGGGGSISMHDEVERGDTLVISEPRNFFPLSLGAPRTLLIAGGIGITPIFSMAQVLSGSERDWVVHYCARSSSHAALRDELEALAGGRLMTHFSEEAPVLDVAALLASQPGRTAVYCCGPVGLMSAVKSATAAWDASRVHFEWFSAPEMPHEENRPFEVELARSGRVLTIPVNRTIMEVLREHGIDVASSCEEGVCGTCETRLLAGEADHRDLLLTLEERSGNRTIMICVSRARTGRLVLDL